jgi:hypothetical protein
MKLHSVLITISLLLLNLSINAKTFYLSPSGNDVNPGTMQLPFFSLNMTWNKLSAGDTVYLRGGTYRYNSTQFLTGKNGAAENLIKIWSYPGETPIITKSVIFSYTWASGICFTGNYFHWKGIEITGFVQESPTIYVGLRITDSNHNIFEQINSHHNGHGCVITGKSGNNLVLNSDFHHNQDPLTTPKYDNADGLEICYIPEGLTNMVRGCRFWWNSDDGIDLWQNDGAVTIESCWSFNNGFIPDTYSAAGNGSGFKLGKTTINHGTKVLRLIRNCVAYNNRVRGFDQNNALCSMDISNNTAHNNGTNGYVLNYEEIFCQVRNCISYKNALMPGLSNSSIIEKNAFSDNNITTPTLFDNDFVSLDGTQLMRARKADGSLPDITFMHPAPGSALIDAGINVGLPFSGQAPDIGAFETVPPAAVVANQHPVVTISSPLKSATYNSPATITVEAAASDPDGAIIKVEFFQGSVKIGERTATPYSITWKEVPEGTYSLTAVATDNANSKTVSVAVSVTVVKPATPVNKSPVVSIAAPTKGSSFTAPATVTVDVNASDPDGSITKVELFNGTVKLYEKTAAPFSFTIKDLPAGSYELKAVATDNMKASSTSSSHAVTVTAIEARDYFNLYPNPNDGRFSIDFTSLLEADFFTVTVVDLIGNTVYREELSKDESSRQFDLSHLYSGTYILMISANQILLTQKFIKG